MKTNCSDCCFLKRGQEGKLGCVAGQYCVIPAGSDESLTTVTVETPGCCRLKRSKKWADTQPQTLDDRSLVAIARHENALKFDLIVIFDEWIHAIEDLQKTIESQWTNGLCNKIIISDIAGSQKSNGYALEYLGSYDGDIPLQVDCPSSNESPVRSIRRMSQKCTSKYFLVLPAGKILSDVSKLAHDIQYVDHRCVMWMFRQKYGETMLSMRGNTIFSLYLRDAFRKLTTHCTEECLDDECRCKSFFNDLKQVEHNVKSEVFLAHFVDSCVII